MRTVTISGVMLFDGDSGLDPAGAGFVVLDEYGLVQPAGPVFVRSDGRPEVTIALEAGRRGNDRDGRLHTVTILAADVAGNQGTASVTITVPRDERY